MDNHGFNHNNPFLADLFQLGNDSASIVGSSRSYYLLALLSSYQMPAPAPVSPVPAAPYRNIVLPSCYVEGHLFLERLPAKLCIMLGEDDHEDPRLWAL